MEKNDLMAIIIVGIVIITVMSQVTSCNIENTKQRQIYLERIQSRHWEQK